MEPDHSHYLAPARFIDSDSNAVQAFAARLTEGAASPRERARRLFVGVRDEIAYDPYVDFDALDTYRASACLAAGRGYCVAKAVLYAAALRAAGVPARVGFADVRNHLATPRLLKLMGSDVFILHGYASLYLDGSWIKATPTFNLSLCERFGVKPLEFDGVNDTLFHEYDRAGRRHMEYLRDHGTFDDVPIERIIGDMRRAYPKLFASHEGDFAAEASSARAASEA
ncbi:MAG: transglutaminase family protein [Alphaproteobacteria bacterium]|nr:transglutaminase family protein [Alphaproteobacteria bacterium]